MTKTIRFQGGPCDGYWQEVGDHCIAVVVPVLDRKAQFIGPDTNLFALFPPGLPEWNEVTYTLDHDDIWTVKES